MASDQQLKTGTTTIGLVNKEGVVLASERRATMGNVIAHKDVQKVYKIDENLGLTTAGLVGDAQLLARYVKAEVELYRLKRGVAISIKSASTLLSNILHRGGGAMGYYYVGLIMGGVDRTGGHVYSLDAAGGSIRDDYVSVGSGSPYAYGVLEDNFEKGMTMDQSVDLAIRALNAAMKRDSASGDGMAIVCISKDGYRELTEDETRKKATKLGIDYPKAR